MFCINFTLFEEYPSDWFDDMAKNPDWHQLSENLVRLQIVFPRAHSEGGYSPTPETLMNLIKNMKNIKDLTLKGISGDPVPLDQFLNQLPSLNKLVLGNCFLCFVIEPSNSCRDESSASSSASLFSFMHGRFEQKQRKSLRT